MSDSGRYLGYDEDVRRWDMEDEAKLLKARVAELEAEVASLRQQLDDIRRHPIGTYKGPVFWCESCGNPYLGLYSHHQCKGVKA